MCMGRLSSSGCGVGGIEGRPRVVASLSSPLRCSGGSWKFATTHKVNIEQSYEGGIFGLPGFGIYVNMVIAVGLRMGEASTR